MIPKSISHKEWKALDKLSIQGLSRAIESVSKDYVYDEETKRFHLEHVFAYELYHKWRELLNQENPKNLRLNAELSKHYNEEEEYRFPDMVLHGGHNNYKHQIIVCEIKSSRHRITTKALKKDINSLEKCINGLYYHCGVFIYLGYTKNMQKMIGRLRPLLSDKSNKKIIFIGVNEVNGDIPHYELL